METRLPLSVAIISFNEAENIARTLRSIADIAAEIVVVDSHSGDATREIAAQFGANVYTEDWKGHVRQKNSALMKCTQPWVLALDCDEVVGADLKRSIISAVRTKAAGGFRVCRRSDYLGKRLRHNWYPDRKLRLVRRSAQPRWEGYDPHDRLVISGPVGDLNGDLIHYSYKNIEDHFIRLVHYARIAADSYYQEGRRFHLHQLVTRPLAAFIKKYFLRAGFLDGLQGLVIAVSSLVYVFLKYMFLWERQHDVQNSTGDPYASK
ncbi:MAG: glycosyltransferase family 2 protein [Desulfosarcinaceae bacterium]|nr:glycosyltransferase family 2 protein [Desulfosarcinaceae bacterium]